MAVINDINELVRIWNKYYPFSAYDHNGQANMDGVLNLYRNFNRIAPWGIQNSGPNHYINALQSQVETQKSQILDLESKLERVPKLVKKLFKI